MGLGERGFTLSEVLIAAGISAFLMLGAVQMMTMQTQVRLASTSQVLVDGDLLLLEDFFSRQVAGAGGNGLTPWAAIWVENNCSARAVFPTCDGSDRLTTINPLATSNCPITGSTVNGTGTDLTIDSTTGCCLNNLNLGNRHVELMNGNQFAQRYVMNFDLSTCTMHVEPGPTVLHVSAVATFDWTGAILIPVVVTTYYRDPTLNELHSYTYSTRTTGPDLILADQVYDFQVALGFDFNPTDGAITDAGNSLDEWLYNDPNAAEEMGKGIFASNPTSTLKMLNIGLISGYTGKAVNSGLATRALDGPVRQLPDVAFRTAQIKTMLRNTGTFD